MGTFVMIILIWFNRHFNLFNENVDSNFVMIVILTITFSAIFWILGIYGVNAAIVGIVLILWAAFIKVIRFITITVLLTWRGRIAAFVAVAGFIDAVLSYGPLIVAVSSLWDITMAEDG